MNIVTVNEENLEREHICCALSDKKGDCCVSSKKAWMRERFQEGLVFQKIDVRGKAFIEYIPAENAWCPVSADGYLFINCFWVSGQYKGKGLSNDLLQACLSHAKKLEKKGLVALSSQKKLPFLSDPKYLKYKGFLLADVAFPSYELYYLPLTADAQKPAFLPCAKEGTISQKGFVLYYSNQCPHTEKYAPLIQKIAVEKGVPFELIKLQSTKEARNAPAPFTTYSLFYDGKLLTNEILSEKKFLKLLEEKGL